MAKLPKEPPVMVSIRFTREAKEQRVETGEPGHKDPTKRTDRHYEIVHAVGKIMEVKESSATHWVARGVAERIGEGSNIQADTGTLPAAPPAGAIPLPPPPVN